MRYHVTGTNHAKGARMSLDVEAGSKAAAERMAQNAGMDVQHIEPIVEGDAAHHGSTHRGEDSADGSGWLIKLIVVAGIVLVVACFLFPKFRMMLHR
jgi:hypothetical protein